MSTPTRRLAKPVLVDGKKTPERLALEAKMKDRYDRERIAADIAAHELKVAAEEEAKQKEIQRIIEEEANTSTDSPNTSKIILYSTIIIIALGGFYLIKKKKS